MGFNMNDELKKYDIILASGSPRRKELLGNFLKGYNKDFKVVVSNVDENKLKKTISLPDQLVMSLSNKKANSVYKKINKNYKNMIVIAADTIVYYNDHILGKPKDADDAINMLHEIQGDVNSVYTGMTVLVKKDDKTIENTTFTKTDVYIKQMSQKDIEEYVSTKEPLDKAGSYAIQGIGKKYIDKFVGNYNSVVGLDTDKLKEKLDDIL